MVKKIALICTISPDMNGEPERISPVSGWRSGAPGGSSSRPTITT